MPASRDVNLNSLLPDWMQGQGVEVTGVDLHLKVHVPLLPGSSNGRSVGGRTARRTGLPAPRTPTVGLLSRGRQPGLRKPVPIGRNMKASDFVWATDYARYLISQGYSDKEVHDTVNEEKGKSIALFFLRKMRDELGVPRDATYAPRTRFGTTTVAAEQEQETPADLAPAPRQRRRRRRQEKLIPCAVCTKPIPKSELQAHIESEHAAALQRPRRLTAGTARR